MTRRTSLCGQRTQPRFAKREKGDDIRAGEAGRGSSPNRDHGGTRQRTAIGPEDYPRRPENPAAFRARRRGKYNSGIKNFRTLPVCRPTVGHASAVHRTPSQTKDPSGGFGRRSRPESHGGIRTQTTRVEQIPRHPRSNIRIACTSAHGPPSGSCCLYSTPLVRA